MSVAVPRYLLNTHNGTLHWLDHLTESCNTDAIPRKNRQRGSDLNAMRADKRFVRDCRHCMPVTVSNPAHRTAPVVTP